MVIWLLVVVAILLFAKNEPLPDDSAPTATPTVVYEQVLIPVEIEPENTAYYKGITLTDEERYELACMVYAEAGNQTDLGKRAVVEVIFNRLLDSRFPDTLLGVLYDPGQFTDSSCAGPEDAQAQYGVIDAVLRETDPLLRNDVVFFATYPANGTLYERIGAHYFCY